MRNLFNYENKFMELLMTIGDLVILNVLFLLCSLPIVTMGAAYAGLYTGLRVLTNKEDDTSPASAFFRGFAGGFGKITIAYCIMLVLIALVGYSAASVVFYDMNGVSAPVWISIAGLCICALFQTTICIFHSRFSCTLGQLFRNAWLLFLAHPLRCLLVSVLTWLPVFVFLVDLQVFILATPIFLAIYFSFAALLSNSLMKKPFQDLIEMYNDKNAAAQETQEETTETEQTAE